jgi:amidohydrolase
MRMVDEGVMEAVDAVVGLHVEAEEPLGSITVRNGAGSAYTDTFTLVIRGREAHGAFPHEGVDAISLTSQVINALQTVVSRRLDPTRGKVLTIGTIQGGTKDNIVAGDVTMTGTIRTFEPDTRDRLFTELEQACGVAQALGGDFELTITTGYIPIINEPGLTALVRQVGADLLGAENVRPAPLGMGGEDFSCFARLAPGCFFNLGSATPGEPPRFHHNPHFDVDERCLPLGSALLAETAIRYLRQGTRQAFPGEATIPEP